MMFLVENNCWVYNLNTHISQLLIHLNTISGHATTQYGVLDCITELYDYHSLRIKRGTILQQRNTLMRFPIVGGKKHYITKSARTRPYGKMLFSRQTKRRELTRCHPFMSHNSLSLKLRFADNRSYCREACETIVLIFLYIQFPKGTLYVNVINNGESKLLHG